MYNQLILELLIDTENLYCIGPRDQSGEVFLFVTEAVDLRLFNSQGTSVCSFLATHVG